MADMAHDPKTDRDLVAISAGHLFKPSITSIAFRRGTFLRATCIGLLIYLPSSISEVIGTFMESQGRGEAKRSSNRSIQHFNDS